jgi:DNA mismatch endonuclease (patch repair protein)
MTSEPRRKPPDEALSRRMASYPRASTRPELRLRQALHALGLRFRVQVPVPGNRRRKIDVAFTRVKVAVFVDGCFWHGCPEHGTRPSRNAEWWAWKIERNRTRDLDTDQALDSLGWVVVRVWEHEDMGEAARLVARVVQDRRGGPATVRAQR